MADNTLEKRVAALEKRIDALLTSRKSGAREKNWRRTRGAFTGDDLMKQIFAEGRKIRAAEKHAANTSNGKKRRARS